MKTNKLSEVPLTSSALKRLKQSCHKHRKTEIMSDSIRLNKTHAIVTGLPRSGTAWVANYWTKTDRVWAHEITTYEPGTHGLFAGACGPDLVMSNDCVEAVLQAANDGAPVLLIYRPEKESLRDYLLAFSSNQETDEALSELFNLAIDGFARLDAELPPESVLRVPFNRLFTHDAQAAWFNHMKSRNFDPQFYPTERYHEAMKSLLVNIHYPHVSLRFASFNKPQGESYD